MSTLENLGSLCKKLGWLRGGVKLDLNPSLDPSPHTPEPLTVSSLKNKIQTLSPSLPSFPRVPAQSQLSFVLKRENLQKNAHKCPYPAP